MPEVEDLVNYAILIAVTVAIILFFTGKFIDLSLERQTSVQSRATINLLQSIITQSDILMEDSHGNKLKLAVDRNGYGAADLTKCCDSVQYDYRFSVGEVSDPRNVVSGFDTKTNYDAGESLNIGDYCYTGFVIGVKSAADVPVNICGNDLNSCSQGVARLETTNSPLSELSYWITQACNSKFDLSKRIPLSRDDYRTGDDITIKDGNVICLKGNCKKFACGKSIGTEAGDPKELLDQEVPRFPLPAYCNFAKVVRVGGVVKVIEGKEEVVEEEVPTEGLFFLPADQDAWTEGYKDHILSIPPGYPIELEVSGVTAAKGSNYIALTRSSSGSAGDISMNMPTSRIKEELDNCKVGGSTVKCIDMNRADRVLDKINFKARLHFKETTANKNGYLTWKLFDVNGVCVQRNYGLLGFGKDTVTSSDWIQYTIDRSGAESGYGKCRIANPNDFLSQIAAGIGTDPFPKEFNWQIANIEFDACEKSIGDFTCAKQLDNLDALLIDNFYFEGVKNEQQ